MYIDRILNQKLTLAIAGFPAVILTGPRQSGKSTFLKSQIGNSYQYITFDDPLNREFAHRDPKGFLNQYTSNSGIILDEIQYVPELFSYIKIMIDESPDKKGRFIMTGSQQFNLMKSITESLAGRVCILELLPFSYSEFQSKISRSIQENLWQGMYPAPVTQEIDRDLWLRSYLGTYIERDIRQLQQIKDLSRFETFLGLCAARHSQILNMADLANEAGISQPTCKEWISALEASYIIFRLPPYHANLGKRLTKSPKLYFIDSGIAAYLTRQPDAASLWSGNMGGAFFEGFVISEAIKKFTMYGKRPDIFFFRTLDGFEIDLLIQANGTLYPLEIKQTATPTAYHAEKLNKACALINQQKCEPGKIVCCVEGELRISSEIVAVNWKNAFGSI